MRIFDISHEFLHHSVERALKAFEIGEFERGGDLTNVYFCGATLCLDIKDKIGTVDVITINHSTETWGLFSGGMRRLIPIKTLKVLEQVMSKANILYTQNYDNRNQSNLKTLN